MKIPRPRPSRLKRILLAFLAVEMLASPVLFMMEDGPPKIIAAGIWFAIMVLTAGAVFFIGLATSISDKRQK